MSNNSPPSYWPDGEYTNDGSHEERYAYYTANRVGKQIVSMKARSMSNEQVNAAFDLLNHDQFTWRNEEDPAFQKALDEELGRLNKKFSVDDRVKELLPKAITTLQEILAGGETIKASDRIAAAKLVGEWAGVGKGKEPQEVDAESMIKRYAKERY